jgi:hypothetical protein
MSDTSDRDAELAPETLRLMFELAREAPDGQLRAADAVDSKIFQAFAAASVLIGLAAVHGPKRDNLATAFLAAAAAAFLILAVVSVRALWSRRFRVPISPHQLWRRYWSDTPEVIKHAFIADIASGYLANEDHLTAKHRALRWVLSALLVEAGAIGAALIVSAV